MLFKELIAGLELEGRNYWEAIEHLKNFIAYHKMQVKKYKELITDIPHDDYYYALLHEYNFHN